MALETKTVKEWIEYLLNKVNAATSHFETIPLTADSSTSYADGVLSVSGTLYKRGYIGYMELNFTLSSDVSVSSTGLPFLVKGFPVGQLLQAGAGGTIFFSMTGTSGSDVGERLRIMQLKQYYQTSKGNGRYDINCGQQGIPAGTYKAHIPVIIINEETVN